MVRVGVRVRVRGRGRLRGRVWVGVGVRVAEQPVEQRRLARVGLAYDAHLQGQASHALLVTGR